MVQIISKGLYGNDAVLGHVICYLVNNENDTEKYQNIIEDYDTAKKLFTSEYVFTR